MDKKQVFYLCMAANSFGMTFELLWLTNDLPRAIFFAVVQALILAVWRLLDLLVTWLTSEFEVTRRGR